MREISPPAQHSGEVAMALSQTDDSLLERSDGGELDVEAGDESCCLLLGETEYL